MRQELMMGIVALVLTIIMPAALLEQNVEEEPLVLVIEQPDLKTEEQTIRLDKGGCVEELPLETYLIGVVLSEMPASFELEALKAQAVAARTFALRQMKSAKHDDADLCANSQCCQAWIDNQSFAEKLGEQANRYWEKAETAVQETRGQVLTYQGELIEAVYFSCSGGSTEDAVAVWGSEVPYLQSVTSQGEENASVYETTVEWTTEDLRTILLEEVPDAQLNGAASAWLGREVKTRGGGIASLELGGTVFSGTTLRRLLGLNSTRFSVEATENGLRFHVFGYGHRVGMSQYGANAMALAGSNYAEILTHYYAGVTIETRTEKNCSVPQYRAAFREQT